MPPPEASTGRHESVPSSSTAARDGANDAEDDPSISDVVGKDPAGCRFTNNELALTRVGSWLIFSRFFAEKLGTGPPEDELWQNVG